MRYDTVKFLGNPRLEKLIEENYHRFKDVINEDCPMIFLDNKIKEIALTEYLNETKLQEIIRDIQEDMSDSIRDKMQDVMYCGISSVIFKDLSINIYNAKKILGIEEAFTLIKNQIQDPVIIGNVILLTLAIEMEVR